MRPAGFSLGLDLRGLGVDPINFDIENGDETAPVMIDADDIYIPGSRDDGPYYPGQEQDKYRYLLSPKSPLSEADSEILIAGLKPLPINRMLRQPARKRQKMWGSPNVHGYGRMSKDEVNSILRRTQATKEAIDKWDPIQAEWEERLNQNNPNPRSRAIRNTVKQDADFKYNTETALMNMAGRALNRFDQSVFDSGNNRLIEYLDLLPPAQAAEYRRLKYKEFDEIDKRWSVREDWDPYKMNADLIRGRDRDLNNDLLAEWKTNRRLKEAADAAGRVESIGDLIRTVDTPISESQSLNEIMFPGI